MSEYKTPNFSIDLSGQIALVTGASSGLGYRFSKVLASCGAKVAISARRKEKLESLAEEIKANGGECMVVPIDMTNRKSIKSAVDIISKELGTIDTLVNNAGIGNGGDIESMDIDTWKLVHNVNLDSVFLGCKLALPLMRDSGNGSIINISSMSGIVASHNTSAYNSSKAAVRHLSKSIALHCAKSTNLVRCNSIHPVFTRTAMVQSMIDAAPERNIEQKLIQQIPIRKLAEPKDIANAAVFLASDESSFITGTEILIDGGLSAT